MTDKLEKITKEDLLKGDTGSYFIPVEALDGIEPIRLEAFQTALMETAAERGLELRKEGDFDRLGITIYWQPRPQLTEFETLVSTIIQSSTGAYVISAALLPEGYQDVFKAVSEGENKKITVEEVAIETEFDLDLNSSVVKVFWAPTDAWFNDDEPAELEEADTTFMQDLMKHMSAVPEGEIYVEPSIIFADDIKNMEQLTEFFKMVTLTKPISIRVVESSVDRPGEVFISWTPSAKA